MRGIVDVLVPNREESTDLLGYKVCDDDAINAAQQLRTRFNIPTVCITLGSGGCAFVCEEGSGHFGVIPVKRIDKVGASDIFIAAFEMALALNHSIPECVSFAGLCAGLSVSKQGGLESAPRPNEIAKYINETHSFTGRDEAIAVLKSVETIQHG